MKHKDFIKEQKRINKIPFHIQKRYLKSFKIDNTKNVRIIK
jgi:hypothetical protein